MDFPPRSRDLNHIENLWDHLIREKAKHDPTSKEKLWDALKIYKINLSQQYLEDLLNLYQEE